MSDLRKKQVPFSNPDAASSGRPRSTSRPKPVTEARATAQRQKIQWQRTQRLEQADREERQLEPLLPSPKRGSQSTTVNRAIEAYIQDQVGGNRSEKTIEWHQNALGFFSAYLTEHEHITLVTEIDAMHISGWFTHLRTTIGGHGKLRSERTVQTYARSVRAFCHWLIRRRLITLNPFDEVIFPKVGRPLIKIFTEEEFEKLLWACAPPNEKSPLAERAAVRNRVILWVLYDTGIRVSELCGLGSVRTQAMPWQ